MGYLTFPPPGSHFPPPYRWSGKFGKDQSSQTDRFGNFGNFGKDQTNFHEVSERCCVRVSSTGPASGTGQTLTICIGGLTYE